jgi:hypothetical protein
MELACKNLYMFFCGNRCHTRFIIPGDNGHITNSLANKKA